MGLHDDVRERLDRSLLKIDLLARGLCQLVHATRCLEEDLPDSSGKALFLANLTEAQKLFEQVRIS